MLGIQDESKRSAPHRRVERILDAMGLSYISEHDEFKPYSLDIYLGEWHCAIEVDGPTHSKAKDRKRDANLLARYGIPVLHISTKVPLSAGDIKQNIKTFIEEYAKTARARKQAWLAGEL